MKLIVGLGNPGRNYAISRHNIGFFAVDYLAKEKESSFKKDSYVLSSTASFKIGAKKIILAKPLTFMNLSGEAVRLLMKKYAIDIADLLVVCDDLDIEFGTIRLKAGGSSAGHRGIESIINSLGTDRFTRLRIGIKRHSKKIDAAEYVLSSFKTKEAKELKNIIEKAADCCLSWLCEGLDKSMNIFNRRIKE